METQMHDFGDGAGPVAAHRHGNGGGWVTETATVDATAYVGPDATVRGSATVGGRATVWGSARVEWTRQVLEVGPIGSRDDALTVIWQPSGLLVTTGCFHGTLDEFAAAVTATHGDDEYTREYRLAIAFAVEVLADRYPATPPPAPQETEASP